MDTKSKRSRPFLVWLCFFIGISIIISIAAVGLVSSEQIYFSRHQIKPLLTDDIKGQDDFRSQMASYFDSLAREINDYPQGEKSVLSRLQNEGSNLLYYAENISTGETLGNFVPKENFSKDLDAMGYDYYLHYNGSRFEVRRAGEILDVCHSDSGYADYLYWYITSEENKEVPGLEGCKIILAVSKTIHDNPNGYSRLYVLQHELESIRIILLFILLTFVVGVVLLVVSILKRASKREFDRKLASISSFFWLEVKALITIGLLSILFGWNDEVVAVGAFATMWWFYLMFIDIRVNGTSFFKHNSINSICRLYRSYEARKPFEKALIVRLYALIMVEAMLVLLSVIGIWSSPILALAAILAGVYVLYCYIRRYTQMVSDLGKIIDQTERMANGDTSTKLTVEETELSRAADNLNTIQEGIDIATDERLRAERMKVELITNVSHDLKTPLTSIISYADLLSKEENLPDHIKDYVEILTKKSERLRTMILDLFDISKAASGSINLNMEKLDLARLIHQTLADMDDEILESGLTFKVNVSDEPVYVMSDGSKLYRVFQNLISNALKYSLLSTRVFIELQVSQGRAVASVKNIANYEMTFTATEIMERFTRGDESRHTEGSGLGLSIAKSFTEACGGRFRVDVDGDLFKAEISFNALESTKRDGVPKNSSLAGQ